MKTDTTVEKGKEWMKQQVNNRTYENLTQLAMKNGSAYAVLMVLSKYMDKKNCLMISNEKLASELQTSTKTIQRAIRVLREKEIIITAKCGTSNVYFINPAAYFTGAEEQFQQTTKEYKERLYAILNGKFPVFDSNVIIDNFDNAE